MSEMYGFDAKQLERIKTDFDSVAQQLNAAVEGILDIKDRTAGVWDSDSIGTYHLEIGNFANDANSLGLCVQKFREWTELVEQVYTTTDANNDEMWAGYSANG